MSISLYTLILFVHIAAAIHLVGRSLLSPAILRRVEAAQAPAELLTWVEFFQRVTRWNPASAMVLLGSGIYLGASGWWRSGWFYVSLFSWIVTSVLAAGVVQPAAARIARAATSEANSPARDPDLLRPSRGWRVAEKLIIGGDVAILWIMVAKPSLFASIAIFVGTSALFVLGGRLFAKRGEARAVIAQGA